MTNTTISGSSTRRFSKRRLGAAGTAIALLATGAVTALGAQSFADDESVEPLPPPGEPYSGPVLDAPTAEGDLVIGSSELIETNGSNFDETILYKHFPAAGFTVFQGSGQEADVVDNIGNTCFRPSAASGGSVTAFHGGLELPDGAQIKRISFYGRDNDGVEDIAIRLDRADFVTPFSLGGPTASSTLEQASVDAFSTSGAQSDATIVFGADNLEERTGTPSATGLAASGFRNRFHTVRVDLANAAGSNHVFCGVRVDYQVTNPADPGTVFHPIGPIRAFDSRQESFAESGRLGPNETKVIDITDGYDSSGVAIPAQADLVPKSATAVAYNITIAGAAGPNFVAVTAGDAAEFTASAINYSGTASIANGSTVTVDSDQQIKLWGGGNTGSAHVIIDIVGYYSAPVPPNMAN